MGRSLSGGESVMAAVAKLGLLMRRVLSHQPAPQENEDLNWSHTKTPSFSFLSIDRFFFTLYCAKSETTES